MQFEHLGARPRIHPSAVIAPTAVISGDVEIGADCQVLHGAVITAEGGPLTLAENVIVMENALLRASATNPVHIGAHSLVGPMASVSGATVGDEVFLATGTRVFNGARVGDRSEVRINAVVHLRTTLPADSMVPIGWVAVGDPVQILPPDRHEEIWAAQKELDFPGYVFGLDRETPDLMMQLTERYGRSLARHAHDTRVD
ncbi:gamma carbonic anhydrase family protein [Microbacterium sp. RU33B]|uniref:gamma carbonic anhydrase family protein n=1 Tax=Microbacterium sp. RU33B TaxID=1907390 RepID=UPI0009685F93|nr:gamma carbonic anhydrase family protein [Microbacterium sp. RU33B]SIT71144.1 Carbonic anhydrase or acetyltransferase, isoleucine patch superfamily [Microbacterium sp. RU33B]